MVVALKSNNQKILRVKGFTSSEKYSFVSKRRAKIAFLQDYQTGIFFEKIKQNCCSSSRLVGLEPTTSGFGNLRSTN